ncbi:recombinase family protein [Streptomyces sp. WMMB303]|uniref:recombinase family protein n=1 Tax=Streptomyces sp. WMMB303 TaxID=3034154 RepID=UPI0023EA82DB|nr:recombinase family protein [Streptomyces sp. WMMB303]MDF4250088.1 recombinase family protein [Streptomyces sp. WMMB303]
MWVYARLSRTTEASTSVERQLRDGRELAERRWPTAPVFEITDDDVSGAVDPAKREGFGAVMRKWRDGDVVVFWKVDRLARSLVGFVDVMRTAQAAGVALVSCRDAFDLSTPDGRMQAQILAVFAEYEREMVKTRVGSMRRHLHAQGKWTGGRAPYGLTSAPHPSGQGRVLVRDEEAAEVVREIVARVLAGDAITRIAADLESRGVPSPRMRTSTKAEPRKSAWNSRGIRVVLESPTIVGHQTDPQTGRLVREGGLPVQVWEPIVSVPEQQQALASLPAVTGRAAPRGHFWLYDVAKCGICGGNLKQSNGGKYQPDVTVLRCAGPLKERHPIVTVRLDSLTEYVDEQVGHWLKHVDYSKREWVGGHDTAADLLKLRTFLDELEADRKAGLYEGADGRKRYQRQYLDTRQEIEALESVPAVESGWRAVSTGREFGEFWDGWHREERGDRLRSLGVTVSVNRPPTPRARVPLSERAEIEWGAMSDAVEDLEAVAREDEWPD